MSKKKEEILTGVFDDVTSEEYHNGRFKDYMGHSGLVEILKSPAHFKVFKEGEKKVTQAMEFGTAAHIVMLENPHLRIAVANFDNRKSNAFKEFYDNSMKAGFEVIVLKEEWDNLMRMREVLFKHNIAKNLIMQGKPELTGTWIDPEFGNMKCKIRADYWINDNYVSAVVDYKSCQDATEEKVMYTVDDMGYDIQYWWYSYGAKKLFSPRRPFVNFVFIFQEKTAPFAINVFSLNPDYQAIGEAKTRKAIEIYNQCILDNSLFDKSYPDKDIIELKPPTKLYNKYIANK